MDDAWAAVQWIETERRRDSASILAASRWAATAPAACWPLSSRNSAREKGGIKIAYQLLLFPNTQMGGETASLNEFAVGYFLERRAIEYFQSLYLTPDADTASPKSVAAARQGFCRDFRRPM